MVEQLICNQQVGGSSPSTSSRFPSKRQTEYGGIPEWPKGADCKSVVSDFGGSNPPSPTKNSEHPSGWSEFFDFRRRWIRKAALSNVPVARCNRRGFSAEKANPPSCCKFRADFRGEYRLSRNLRVLHSATLTPTLTPTAMGRNVPGWTK